MHKGGTLMINATKVFDLVVNVIFFLIVFMQFIQLAKHDKSQTKYNYVECVAFTIALSTISLVLTSILFVVYQFIIDYIEYNGTWDLFKHAMPVLNIISKLSLSVALQFFIKYQKGLNNDNQ